MDAKKDFYKVEDFIPKKFFKKRFFSRYISTGDVIFPEKTRIKVVGVLRATVGRKSFFLGGKSMFPYTFIQPVESISEISLQYISAPKSQNR